MTFGQSIKKPDNEITGHLFTLTYSNNGQINGIIDEFYFSQGAYLPNNDVFKYKQCDLKFNFHYEYVTHKNFSFFCKVGYSVRKDIYTISNVTPAHGSKEQNYLNISLGSKYNFRVDRFQFSTGIEIPFYNISTYKEKFFYDNTTQTIHSTQFIDGGTAFGLNSISSIKFFLSKKIFLSTDLTFGLLFFNLGGQTYSVIDYQNPVVYPTTGQSRDDKYNKTAVTKPEFYFGIGIKI